MTIALIMVVLILVWYYFHTLDLPYIELLESLKAERLLGPFFYMLLTFAAIVLAPLSTMAITPFAANVWGWQIVFIASIIGWQLGCVVNFLIAKKFRYWTLKKTTKLKKIDKLTENLTKRKQFYMIFLLRMIIPADVLSYALGLTKVSLKIYFWATFIGIMPFAFMFSYGGILLDSIYMLPFIAIAVLMYFISGRTIENITKL